MVTYVGDVYDQYFTWRMLAEVISEYSKNLEAEIAMKLIANQIDEIVAYLNREVAELKKAKEDVNQKVGDLKAPIEQERKNHVIDMESVHHRNHDLAEKVRALEAQLESERKEKDEAL